MKTIKFRILRLVCLLSITGGAAAAQVVPPTWTAQDALGRTIGTDAQYGKPRPGKTVGMFFVVWHGAHGYDHYEARPDMDVIVPGKNDTLSPYDIQKLLDERPDAPQYGPVGAFHHWGEPYLGYYVANDEWVIRKHAQMLSDAGVDMIMFDVTNQAIYLPVVKQICDVYTKMRKEGNKTPQISFIFNTNAKETLENLFDSFYGKNLYKELWFRWKGKPLLMFGQHIIGGRQQMDDVRFPKEIRDFFTIRQSWAWTTLRWYDDGHDEWPWVDHYPQSVGWHESPDRAEYVPVASAQHPLSNIGRSFRDGVEPEHDRYDATTDTDKGLYFDQQWQRALEVDPEFIFVTGWNEWTAGQMNRTNPDYAEEMKKWDFFPGAKCGKGGREVKMGEGYFIDQYNQEFSRDIEPMKGGHTDNYYYQLIANVRKYKGVAKPEPAGEPVTIDLNGGFDQWRQVKKTYYDHAGDTYHRDSPGNFAAGPYVNATGRNDIIESKVARDDKYVYFYVKTAQPLTPHTDPYWMLLFIDTDRQHATGWEGYDLLVNDGFRSGKSMVKTYDKTGWRKSREAAYRYQGNELMVSVPRSCFGPGKLAFDFHWADGIQKLGDIDEFLLNGDQAPSRRANYRYEED